MLQLHQFTPKRMTGFQEPNHGCFTCTGFIRNILSPFSQQREENNHLSYKYTKHESKPNLFVKHRRIIYPTDCYLRDFTTLSKYIHKAYYISTQPYKYKVGYLSVQYFLPAKTKIFGEHFLLQLLINIKLKIFKKKLYGLYQSKKKYRSFCKSILVHDNHTVNHSNLLSYKFVETRSWAIFLIL